MRSLTIRLTALLCSLAMLPVSLSGQENERESPYEFNLKRDAVYASGAVVFTGMGYFSTTRVQPHTEATVLSLDKYTLPGFDRSTVGNWNPTAASVSDYMMFASAAMPLLMLADRRARQDWLGLGLMYIEVAGLTVGLTQLAKGFSRRTRPYGYDPDVAMEQRTSHDARMSFFSGHTSLATSMCFLTAKVFSDYSDNRTAKSLVWTAAVIAPAVVGYLRVNAGKHFPSDVIAGYLVGGTIGYLVPELHKKRRLPKGLTVAPFGSPFGSGIYLSYDL